MVHPVCLVILAWDLLVLAVSPFKWDSCLVMVVSHSLFLLFVLARLQVLVLLFRSLHVVVEGLMRLHGLLNRQIHRDEATVDITLRRPTASHVHTELLYSGLRDPYTLSKNYYCSIYIDHFTFNYLFLRIILSALSALAISVWA